MKTRYLIYYLTILSLGCNQESKIPLREQPIVQEVAYKVEIASSSNQKPGVSPASLLLNDKYSAHLKLSGKYLIADRYQAEIQSTSSGLLVTWERYGTQTYHKITGKYHELNYWICDNPDFGRFIQNPRTGHTLFEVIEENRGTTDTLYYEVSFDDVDKKKRRPVYDDFDGTYAVIGRSRDSTFFQIKKIAPFKYNLSNSNSNSNLIYFEGRDQYGLLKYGNYTMNSDHLSGLYITRDDSNSTVVKLNHLN